MNYCCIANICKLYNVIAAAHVYDIMIELSFFLHQEFSDLLP